jgi:hypothetical protein
MTKFLAGILTVIAAGVLLIAYGLLNPPAAAFNPTATGYGAAPPMVPGEQIVWRQTPYATSVAGGHPGASYPAAASVGYVRYAAPQMVQYDPRAVQYDPGAVLYEARPVPYDPRPVQSDPGLVQYDPRVRSASLSAPQRPIVRQVIEKKPRRNWKKTAILIGGSSAAGAGLGALLGGKKGALIGAAIGGGAGTIYETTKGR